MSIADVWHVSDTTATLITVVPLSAGLAVLLWSVFRGRR